MLNALQLDGLNLLFMQLHINFAFRTQASLADTLPAPFGDEIKGIANATGMPLGKELYNGITDGMIQII